MTQVKRHLLKTISYRVISTTIGFFLVWYITNSIELSSAFTLSELLYKPIIYFIHERIWYKWIRLK